MHPYHLTWAAFAAIDLFLAFKVLQSPWACRRVELELAIIQQLQSEFGARVPSGWVFFDGVGR